MPSRALQPLPTLLPSLDPAILDASAAAAVREILAEAASANTTRSYTSALRYWAAWFTGRYGRPLTLPLSKPRFSGAPGLTRRTGLESTTKSQPGTVDRKSVV